jgi:hypothetical protein
VDLYRSLIPALLLSTVACGGMSGMGMSSNSSAMRSYGTLGGDMSTTLSTYSRSSTSMADDAACNAAHAAYQPAMAGMIDRMKAMSATMDSHMAQYGLASVGSEMACVADALAAELARHHGVACAAADVSADRDEAALHVGITAALLHHQRAQYESAGSMMGMMQSPPDATWTCEQTADGTFTIGGATWTPGTPLSTSGSVDLGPWPMPCDGSCGGCSGADLGMGGM